MSSDMDDLFSVEPRVPVTENFVTQLRTALLKNFPHMASSPLLKWANWSAKDKLQAASELKNMFDEFLYGVPCSLCNIIDPNLPKIVDF